jgi:hypothetical protein
VTLAASLRAIQTALERDFSADAGVAECCAGAAVHLLYAHRASPVAPTSLVPLVHTPFNDRAGSFPWTTPPLYEAATAPRYNQPYRDFIASRFVWKERPEVTFTKWPTGATEPEATGDDGGTLIEFEGASARTESELTAEVPADPELPAGYPAYPTIRQVCLSIPGVVGAHADINSPDNDTNAATLAYPSPGADDSLRLLAVTPHMKIELRPANGAAVPIANPWTDRISYGVTTAAQYGSDVYESTTGQRIGGITRYTYRGTRYFGIANRADDSSATLRAAYLDNPTRFSAARALVLDTVLSVEGGPAAVATYDGPKLSWGMNQFIIPAGGTGELHQILCYIYDFFPEAFENCFGRYGFGVRFTSRARVWHQHTTYGNPVLYRVPCCSTGLPANLDAIRTALAPGEDAAGVPSQHAAALAAQFAITRQQTTTAGAIYVFHRAGYVADIQQAQLQWSSYRVTRALRGVNNPTVRDGVTSFLRSLGASAPEADRLRVANGALQAAADRGVTTDPNGAFTDEGSEAEWYDWEVRCQNAGKEVT